MQTWFEELEAGEKCAACAIVDDKAFVHFFLSLVEEERTQQNHAGTNHALFSKEYLAQQYFIAKDATRNNQTRSSSTVATAIESGTEPSKEEEESLLSFLRGTAKDTASKSNGRCELVEEMCMNDVFYFSSPSSSSMGSSRSISSQRSSKPSIGSKQLPTGKDAPELFQMALMLQSCLGVSFATSGSDCLDSLFVLRPLTEDGGRLIGILRELSHGGMFSDPLPTEEQVKESLRGSGGFPTTHWLSRHFDDTTSPQCTTVPYYLLLMARMELAMYRAYYNSARNHNNSMNALRKASFSNAFDPSWEVLNHTTSSLARLSASAVMLSLASMAEETKPTWQLLPLGDRLIAMNLLPPVMRRFYAGGDQTDKHNNNNNNNNSTSSASPSSYRGRPECLIDRLLVCPLEWLLEQQRGDDGSSTDAAEISDTNSSSSSSSLNKGGSFGSSTVARRNPDGGSSLSWTQAAHGLVRASRLIESAGEFSSIATVFLHEHEYPLAAPPEPSGQERVASKLLPGGALFGEADVGTRKCTGAAAGAALAAKKATNLDTLDQDASPQQQLSQPPRGVALGLVRRNVVVTSGNNNNNNNNSSSSSSSSNNSGNSEKPQEVDSNSIASAHVDSTPLSVAVVNAHENENNSSSALLSAEGYPLQGG